MNYYRTLQESRQTVTKYWEFRFHTILTLKQNTIFSWLLTSWKRNIIPKEQQKILMWWITKINIQKTSKRKKHSFLLRIVFNEYLINEIKGAFRNQTYFVVVSAWNFSSEFSVTVANDVCKIKLGFDFLFTLWLL